MSDGPHGYLLPDNPDIQELVCIRVFVPKHTLFIGAFWGAYEYFTKWVAWMRDPLKRGKVAARSWLRAYERSRAEYLLTNGECFDMITDIRTNPLDPCVLQVQIDGGAYHDVFDAGCCGGGGGASCGPALRVNGGQVERWNNDNQSWEPAGPVTPPQEQTPPIGSGVSTNDGACLAATNAAHEMNRGLTKFASARAALSDATQTILDAFDFLVAFLGLTWVLTFFGTILSDIWEGFNLQSTEILALDLVPDLVCILLPHYKDDKTMTQAQVNGLVAELDARAATFANETPEWLAWTFLGMWAKAAGSQGMTAAATSQMITTGECDDCPWQVTFDFTVSPCGFVRTPVLDGSDYSAVGPYWGKWIAGQGWKSEDRDIGGGEIRQRLATTLQVEKCNITRAVMYYSTDQGDAPDGVGAMIGAVRAGEYNGASLVFIDGHLTTVDAGIQDRTADTNDVQEVTLQVYIDRDTNNVPGAYVLFSKVVLYGTGPKPGVVPIP
jgi:hypothetical protein